MRVLVTGGAGFIGSHTCVELLSHGHEVIVADDHSNSTPAVLDVVRTLTGRPLASYHADLRDRSALDLIFDRHDIDAVVHFAAKKSVTESARLPVEYFDVNVTGTTNLLRAMLAHGVRDLVFSSSCAIYGDRYSRPITEEDEPDPVSPYARSKLMCEQILSDVCARFQDFHAIALRYFNPTGAHPSGSIGEDPRGVPGNLMPCMLQVAVGRLKKLHVFGEDYPTADGSGVRDYIHVMDLAEAHRVALEHVADESGLIAFNLGTGSGVSVLELMSVFQDVSGVKIPYEITGRRDGDVASLIADPGLVAKEWGWQATRDIQAMCADAWRFQRLHPHGVAALP